MPAAAPPGDTGRSREVRDADASDLPTLLDITTRAYRADPLIAWFVRDDARREDGLRRLFDFCLRRQALPRGQVAIMRDGTACAAWMPPAAARPVMSLGEQIALLPDMARVCSLPRVPRLAAALRLLEQHHPHSPPHYYLYVLAVAPERQGRGIGSALLEAGLRTIDRARAATYLETASARNLPLYERHGFVVTGEARLPFDGPDLWFLWRKPQAG